jgi:hypothetical protein
MKTKTNAIYNAQIPVSDSEGSDDERGGSHHDAPQSGHDGAPLGCFFMLLGLLEIVCDS